LARGNFLCSELSLGVKEEMIGTAPRVDLWLLLQYEKAWSKKAFPSSIIPDVVKKRFSEIQNSIPNSRIQLIKRHKNPEKTIKFYIGVSHDFEPKLYEFGLYHYQEILDLDIRSIILGSSYLMNEPIFLVCTHGAHDRCCGKFGISIYKESVKRENGFLTWQCTHLGGHRFAPNLLCLPHGIYYGRVGESGLENLISEYKNQNISLEYYRGRSCYSADVQAAEYFLRVKTGITKISSIHLKESDKQDKNNSIVKFISEVDGKIHLIHIRRTQFAIKNYTSCYDIDTSDIAQYNVIEHKIE